MTEGEKARLVAWSKELRSVHARLRDALAIVHKTALSDEPAQAISRDLQLFCHGFCTALNGHHVSEDRELFPAIAAQNPELRETLRKLEQDHSMIAHLVAGLQSAIESGGPPTELSQHLEGIAAIMESHFRYEERQLLVVLETLELDADPRRALGPL